jgi:hypothetical protein
LVINIKTIEVMKKVTMWFVVSDEVADNIMNDLTWGEMGNAASTLNENCEESDYNIEDIEY